MAPSEDELDAAQPADTLFRELYEQLHGLAQRKMRQQPAGHTLQATALVNEAYRKLRGSSATPESRGEFYKLAGKAMGQILVDHARRKRARKRAADGLRVDVEDALLEKFYDAHQRSAYDIVDLREALEELRSFDPQLAELVDVRYFAGRSNAECAEVLGLSERQIYRYWQIAYAWLRRRVLPSAGAPPT